MYNKYTPQCPHAPLGWPSTLLSNSHDSSFCNASQLHLGITWIEISGVGSAHELDRCEVLSAFGCRFYWWQVDQGSEGRWPELVQLATYTRKNVFGTQRTWRISVHSCKLVLTSKTKVASDCTTQLLPLKNTYNTACSCMESLTITRAAHARRTRHACAWRHMYMYVRTYVRTYIARTQLQLHTAIHMSR